MQTITHGRAVFTLQPTHNMAEFYAALAKCTGKSKRTAIRRGSRTYPTFRAGMSTAQYVHLFYIANMVKANARGLFEPLNQSPCALYSGADTHEVIEECEEVFA